MRIYLNKTHKDLCNKFALLGYLIAAINILLFTEGRRHYSLLYKVVSQAYSGIPASLFFLPNIYTLCLMTTF